MILRNTLFGAYITEYVQLLLVVSTHTYLLYQLALWKLEVVFQQPTRTSGPRVAAHVGLSRGNGSFQPFFRTQNQWRTSHSAIALASNLTVARTHA